jgi:putative ABC transport system permease protein
LVKLKPNTVQKGLSKIKQSWTEISGDNPFDYQFIDQQLDALYEQERNLGTIVGIASLFAILVGGLGLFALASLNIQNRMKELSIRKILGASNGTTLFLIAKEYMIMIVITLLIASPITWFIMSDWLSTFTYRIDITIVVFLIAGIVATVTAALSISYHSYRAIRTEPIDYLRYE